MKAKIALVTGGSRGLGKSAALRLAEKGHHVIITYHSQKEMADDVIREIEAGGSMATALKYDSGDFSALGDFIKQVEFTLSQKWNTDKFDFLINNAGVGATIPFEKVTESDFDHFMNIHFKSVYFLCQQLLPHMNNNGRIINMSTGTTRFANPGYSALEIAMCLLISLPANSLPRYSLWVYTYSICKVFFSLDINISFAISELE